MRASSHSCVCVFYVSMLDNLYGAIDARLSTPIDSLTRTSKWKTKILHECRYIHIINIYSQMVFIFISNTSIDISFAAFVSFCSLWRLPCYFYAIEILSSFFFLFACGGFYSELMRRMRIDTNTV